MYFWAEKYFSGSSMDQQSGRGSRSGSGGGLLDRKGSFRESGAGDPTFASGTAGGEHRKSVVGGQQTGTSSGTTAQRRESRGMRRESLAGGGSGAGEKQPTNAAHYRKSVSTQQQQPRISIDPRHRGSSATSEYGAAAAAVGLRPTSVAQMLANILRSLAVRALLVAHSLLCIWAAAGIRDDNSVWGFGLLAVCLVGEGFYSIVVRAGDEPRCFSPAILLYLFSTAPPLWLIQSSLCHSVVSAVSTPNSNNNISLLQVGHTIDDQQPSALFYRPSAFGLQPTSLTALAASLRRPPSANGGDGDTRFSGNLPVQLLGHSLFLVLIFARWLLPRADLTREELSQILLAYMAIITDILEFLGMLNSAALCADPSLEFAVLSAWTLSLVQFSMVLTASRSRKMRVAVATKILLSTNKPDVRQAFFDPDVWAILISLALQDVPFLIVRLFVLAWLRDISYANLAFIVKNLLVILLQTYRMSVLLNDRYLNPAIGARSLVDEKRQSMALPPSLSLSIGAGPRDKDHHQHQQQQMHQRRSNTAAEAVPLKGAATGTTGANGGEHTGRGRGGRGAKQSISDALF